MNDFTFYFRYGWEHIISRNALDHILFIGVLTAGYSLRDWKQVIILVTAFTIGHSLTLALSVYDLIRFNSKWVEFFIPVTIMFTALINLIRKRENQTLKLSYFVTLFFGLIHGMGFANTIRFMLSKSQEIGWPLLSFNLGLEAGQILVVLIVLALFYLFVEKGGLLKKWWLRCLSVTAFLISFYMAFTRLPI